LKPILNNNLMYIAEWRTELVRPTAARSIISICRIATFTPRANTTWTATCRASWGTVHIQFNRTLSALRGFVCQIQPQPRRQILR